MQGLKLIRADFFVVFLMVLVVLSQPFGVAFEFFNFLMAVFGCAYVFKSINIFKDEKFKLYSYVFLCFFVPELVSVFSAVNVGVSLTEVLGSLRFYFSGIFVICFLLNKSRHIFFIKFLLIWLIFLAGDAWFQRLTGTDFFGIKFYDSGRISGLFGQDPILGWMCLIYIGAVSAYLFSVFNRKTAVVIFLLFVLTVFISGDRGAWVALFWLICFVPIVLYMRGIRLSKKMFLSTVTCLILFLGTISFNQHAISRFDSTIQAITKNDFSSWDKATSYRLTLWNTTLDVIKDNLITGVGFKGFRYAYPNYAALDDRFVQKDDKTGETTGAHHAHQIVLEVLSETGVIGLLGLLLFYWKLFVNIFSKVVSLKSVIPLGYYLSTVAIFMPINTHLSMGKAYWAQASWLLIALLVSSIYAFGTDEPVADTNG